MAEARHDENELSHSSAAHAAAHFANVKYGYWILGISLAYIIVLVAPQKLQRKGGFQFVKTRETLVPVWVHVFFWSIVSLLLGLYGINLEEYTHNVKRFGRVSYALVPLDIFLVLRPNIINYMNFIDLHKWVSRIIIVTGFIHSFGYIIHWIMTGALIAKCLKLWNFLGVIVSFFSIILLVSSLKPIRRFNYEYFYFVHGLTYWSFLILITLHARPGVKWCTGTGLLLMAYQLYSRHFRSYKIESMDIKEKTLSSLQVINLSMPPNYPSFSAASHIRLNHPWKFYLSTHPYTISSASTETSIKLIVRKTNHFALIDRSPIAVSIPYPCFSSEFFEYNEKTIIICGGSGIAFGLPLFAALNASDCDVEIIWCLRNVNDLFVLNHFDINKKIKVYITGMKAKNEVKNIEESNDIELEAMSSRESLLADDVLNLLDNSLLDINHGRPDLNQAFAPLKYVNDPNNSWLITCGPEELVAASKRWANDNKILFKSEPFEM